MAGPTIRVTIDGQKEIEAALKKLGKWADDALKDVVAAGAEVYRQGASNRAPRGATGNLAGNIVTVIERKKGGVAAAIGPDRKRFYGLIVEFGAAEHEIEPKNRQALKFDGHYAAHATHPGVPAQPFMRPTFDEDSPEAEAAIAAALKKVLHL